MGAAHGRGSVTSRASSQNGRAGPSRRRRQRRPGADGDGGARRLRESTAKVAGVHAHLPALPASGPAATPFAPAHVPRPPQWTPLPCALTPPPPPRCSRCARLSSWLAEPCVDTKFGQLRRAEAFIAAQCFVIFLLFIIAIRCVRVRVCVWFYHYCLVFRYNREGHALCNMYRHQALCVSAGGPSSTQTLSSSV